MTTLCRLGRLCRLAPVLAVLVLLGLAAPAHADVPEGFSPDAESVDPLRAVLVIGGIPLLLALIIVASIYLPSLVRGEDVAPAGTPAGPDQWLGGPRRGTAELAGPDGDESKAGGARGTW